MHGDIIIAGTNISPHNSMSLIAKELVIDHYPYVTTRVEMRLTYSNL